MSLSGNLATFSLDEVVLLLSRTGKTGALRVRDVATEGVVYFEGGRLSGAEVDQVSGAVEGTTALEARLVDVCFALARLDDGSFEFESDRRTPWMADDEVDAGPVVERVRDLLVRWPAIERHVPGVEVTPRLVDALAGDSITIDRAAWPVLVAVDGRANVRSIGTRLGRSALEVAAALATLVEAGAVTVGAATPVAIHVPAEIDEIDGPTGIDAPDTGDEIGAGTLEAQVSALEGVAAEQAAAEQAVVELTTAELTTAELTPAELTPAEAAPVFEVDEVPESVPGPASGAETTDVPEHLSGAAEPDEPVEAVFAAADGVSMLTHDPDALARLNRADLERAALGEPIEDPEPEAADDVLPEPSREPRPAVTRDRGALLRMFSSLRDG